MHDPSTAWALFESAHDPAVGDRSVEQLGQLLRRAAAEINDHDLAALSVLEVVRQAHYDDDSFGSGGTIEGYVDVDCATVRKLAADEIARRGKPSRVIDALATVIASNMDITVRLWALRKLGETADAKALPILRTALKKGYYLGIGAADAMAALGNLDAIPMLEKVIRERGAERYRDVAPSAERALERLVRSGLPAP
jgi:hypothetical protein